MEIGIVRQVSIVDEVRDSYLDYAMSVITSRALPDVRDGLKPVQRRILYAMDDMGLRHDKPHKKSARIVGEVLGKYHPHSDAAVYDAMVRMAQDFTMRYPLVDGHGNFGSVDGDGAAAMRYTEARLSAIAEEMLPDLQKNTIDLADNFDGTLKEPTVLPARLPNLLVNGAAGIAVGMATNIPPHNLAEVCDAIIHVIDHYDDLDSVTVGDLMRFIKGPDFPTGGSVVGREELIAAYATGKGRLIVRAKAHIEDLKGGRTAIIVTELPYQVNKSTLVERIADLVRNRKIETISDLRDESDRTGMRIVIEIKRGGDTQTTLNQLLKYTTMQTTFGVNMLALVDGEPRVLSLKRILQHFIEHREEVIRRRSEFELAHARQRAHILEGLKIALDNLDEVISIIRRSQTADIARTNLMRRFKLTEIQAQAILDLPLRRLAALERRKIEEELAEVRKQIAYLEDLLAHPRKILLLIKQEMYDLRGKYGDARRTRIADEESDEFSAEDLIPSEDVLVAITQRGYIKRVSRRSYSARTQGEAAPAREEDPILHLFAANSMDTALFFTDRGRVFAEKVHQIPDESRQARGVPLSNLISVVNGEAVVSVVSVSDFGQPEYLSLVTTQGRIKRMQLSELSSARPTPMATISLDEGDSLGWVLRTQGGQDLVLVTAQGKAIRFSEEDVRPMGRGAGGVNAIRLAEEDMVAAADIARPESELVVVTRDGYGKRTPISEYAAQARGGAGVMTIDSSRLQGAGSIAAACALGQEEEIALISAEGMVLRTSVNGIPAQARAARGASVLKLKGKDQIVAIAWLSSHVGSQGPAPSAGNEPPDSEPPAKPARGRGKGTTARPKAQPARRAPGTKAPAKQAAARKAAASEATAPTGKTRAKAGETAPGPAKKGAAVAAAKVEAAVGAKKVKAEAGGKALSRAEPTKESKRAPAKAEPAKESKRAPAKAEPAKESKKAPAKAEPAKESKKAPVRAELASETQKVAEPGKKSGSARVKTAKAAGAQAEPKPGSAATSAGESKTQAEPAAGKRTRKAAPTEPTKPAAARTMTEPKGKAKPGPAQAEVSAAPKGKRTAPKAGKKPA